MAADCPLPPIRPAPSVGALRLLQAFRSAVLGAVRASAYSDLRVSFRRFGRRFIFLSDPEDINHVLNTHIDRYQANILAERLLEPLTGRGIVLAEGEEWTQLHRRLIPHLGFAIGELFDFAPLARACRREGRYEFLFTGVPLNVTGAQAGQHRGLV